MQIDGHCADASMYWGVRFGEDVMETMVDWTVDLLQKECPSLPLEAAILDLGTGNGVLPLELASCGFGNLTGMGSSSHCQRCMVHFTISIVPIISDPATCVSLCWAVTLLTSDHVLSQVTAFF